MVCIEAIWTIKREPNEGRFNNSQEVS